LGESKELFPQSAVAGLPIPGFSWFFPQKTAPAEADAVSLIL
jgi:hypothetical protein